MTNAIIDEETVEDQPIDLALEATGFNLDLIDCEVLMSIKATDSEDTMAYHVGTLLSMSIETRRTNDIETENGVIYPVRVWFDGRPEPVQTYAHLVTFTEL